MAPLRAERRRGWRATERVFRGAAGRHRDHGLRTLAALPRRMATRFPRDCKRPHFHGLRADSSTQGAGVSYCRHRAALAAGSRPRPNRVVAAWSACTRASIGYAAYGRLLSLLAPSGEPRMEP